MQSAVWPRSSHSDCGPAFLPQRVRYHILEVHRRGRCCDTDLPPYLLLVVEASEAGVVGVAAAAAAAAVLLVLVAPGDTGYCRPVPVAMGCSMMHSSAALPGSKISSGLTVAFHCGEGLNLPGWFDPEVFDPLAVLTESSMAVSEDWCWERGRSPRLAAAPTCFLVSFSPPQSPFSDSLFPPKASCYAPAFLSSLPCPGPYLG